MKKILLVFSGIISFIIFVIVAPKTEALNYGEIFSNKNASSAVYRMETTADASGNSFTLTASGTVFDAGRFVNALDSGSATSGNTKLAKNTSLQLNNTTGTGKYTVRAYFLINATPTSQGFIFQAGNTGSGGMMNSYTYRNNAGTVQYNWEAFNGSTGQEFNSTGSVPVGTWHHFVMEQNLSTATLYIDGVQKINGTINLAKGTGSGNTKGIFLLNHNNTTAPCPCKIDDLIIMQGIVWTSQQVQSDYAQSLGRRRPTIQAQ
jgi:hypothetical protein